MSFVYVLRGEKTGRRYVGHTANLDQRLGQHNNGVTKSTKCRGPWRLIHHEEFGTRSEAASREWFLKWSLPREARRPPLSQRGA
jgi:putative endonuclease